MRIEALAIVRRQQSTGAAAARNADLARMQTGVNADMYGNELAKQKIANYASAFNLREQGRAGQLAKEEAAFNLKSQERDQVLADKRAQNLNALQIGGGIMQNDLNKAQGSPAPALANQILRYKIMTHCNGMGWT